PFCLERYEASSLALENIKRMPPNSIGCVLERVILIDTWLINILPKLRIKKDCEVGDLTLNASREEHVAGILKQEKPFCVGRVKSMWLWGYAAGVITKMSLEDCEFEFLYLHANKEEHAAAVLEHDKAICVGRVKVMVLCEYAVGFVTKMSPEDCVAELLRLTASEEAHVAAVLGHKRKFCVGRVKRMELEDYAVSVLTKMSLEDCEFEKLRLIAEREEYVSVVLEHDKTICVGRVKKMFLCEYAVSILTKMIIHEDNTMESLNVAAYGKELSRILKEGDSSIDLGRIITDGFDVPEEIQRKLKYTLVDGEASEVPKGRRLMLTCIYTDEEGNEVLEERSSQRGSRLE
ncbi:MAG: uncharacterized protein A8A55_3284, partial [Amphiamblys sp. WSBS2006]